ncbi:MAG: AsmA-like C-terminal domain-containing protein [Candidatus Paracaedimonas acanthamoebae]|uniref:AsmA-like C-terminal domain-containing protein n=1 Tax=Candidatus Paracaedimonas acanthamoebae TaxID=244581 RepID=A0A8J7PLK4_9PROT|nr:AsmA-like C-terminal domain-containing protein [Candidatus Paracaedimonas acanthamoebae]
MEKNIIKKILLYFFGAITGILGIGFVVGAVFLARLHHTPLILKDLHPNIIKSFEAIVPDYKLSFDYAMVTWESIRHPIAIRAENVKVKGIEEKRLKISFPELQISFSIPSLLMGNFSIRTLKIVKPALHFIYENITPSPQILSEEVDQFFLNLVDNFLKENKKLKKLKHVKIDQADIKIENLQRQVLFHIPNLTLTLKRKDKKQKFNITGNIQKSSFQLSGISDHRTGEILADINIQNNSQKILPSIQPKESHKKTSKEQDQILFLQGLEVPFSMVSKFLYSEKEGLKEASFMLELSKGKIDLPSFFIQPIEVLKGGVEAFYTNNHLHVKKVELQTGGTHIRATTEGTWDKSTQGITLKSKVEVENVLLSDLDKLWPINLAKTPRQWVIKNIPQGKAPKATLELDSIITLQEGKIAFLPKNLGGIIKIQEATVSYLEGMPKVTNVNGEARYSFKNFFIKLDSGKIHQLNLKNGDIDISELDKETQKIDIQLMIHGSLSQHLSLVDHKPLEYAKKLSLKPSQVLGEAQTSLHLKFPLLTTITLKEIEVDVDSKLFDTRLSNIIEAFPCELYNGKFDLKINKENMIFDGQGYIFGIPFNITWQKNFNLASDFDTKFDLTGVIDEKLFNHQKINFIREVVGKAPLELHYVEKKNSQGNLHAKVDLTNLHARILGWLKPGKVRGGGEISLEMHNFSPQKLFFKAKVVDGIHIEGEGSFDNLGLKELTFPQFKVGLTNIHFNILRLDNQAYAINLLGKSLNLEPLWQTSLNSSEKTLSSDFNLKAKVDDVFFGSDRAIYNSDLSLNFSKGVLSDLDFKAELSKKNPDTTVEVHLSSNDPHTRKIKLKTAYGGKFLKAVGIYENIYGGNLSILATHDDRMPQDPWQGKVMLTDFSLKKAPIMGKLLTLAFPTGVVDLFSEKGLPFHHFRSKFNATTSKVVFTKGRANGTSIGLTFAGTVDLQKKKLQLYGSVIPAYYLNTILSKVPLIGELVSGGKHEGLFSVAYTISGDSEKPEITVNPVSIFTPGFVRKIFEPEIDESFDDNEEEEYKELRE